MEEKKIVYEIIISIWNLAKEHGFVTVGIDSGFGEKITDADFIIDTSENK